MSRTERDGYDRRRFLRVALGAPLAIPAAGALLGALGCGGQETAMETAGGTEAAPEPKPPAVPPPAAAPPPMADAGGEKKLVTEVPAMSALVQQLQYVHESAKPGQNCTNCLFYTAENGGIGKCQLFPQGYVKANGWCASWTQKPA